MARAGSLESKVSIATLAFLTVWLCVWSIGVGVLSSLLMTSGGSLWLFICTHGGAELGAAWLITGSFLHAAKQSIDGPELSLDLAGMTASWGPQPRLHLLTLWFIGLGGLVCSILSVGTWLPVYNGPTASSIILASILSVAWGFLGWRWLRVLFQIRALAQSVTVEATFDRVTVTRSRGLLEHQTELAAASLEVSVDASQLLLTGPEASLSVHCGQTPDREQMVSTLQEMASRAASSPFEQPPLPEGLQALRGTPEHT